MKRLIIGLAMLIPLAACAPETTPVEETPEPEPAAAAAPPSPLVAVALDEDVRFAREDGESMVVSAGPYRVEADGETGLRLTHLETARTFVVPAGRHRARVPPDCAITGSPREDEDAVYVALGRRAGGALVAVGSRGGARLRGTVYDTYDFDLDNLQEYTAPLQRNWNPNYKRIVLLPADFDWEPSQNIVTGGGAFLATDLDWDTYPDQLAIAPVPLPAGARVRGIHMAWVRDWNLASEVASTLSAGKEMPKWGGEYGRPKWREITCLLRYRDFGRREVFTWLWVDTLSFLNTSADTTTQRAQSAMVRRFPETDRPDWYQGSQDYDQYFEECVFGTGDPTETAADLECHPLAIGQTSAFGWSPPVVPEGTGCYVELRLPPGFIRTPPPPPFRRVLGVVVVYSE